MTGAKNAANIIGFVCVAVCLIGALLRNEKELALAWGVALANSLNSILGGT